MSHPPKRPRPDPDTPSNVEASDNSTTMPGILRRLYDLVTLAEPTTDDPSNQQDRRASLTVDEARTLRDDVWAALNKYTSYQTELRAKKQRIEELEAQADDKDRRIQELQAQLVEKERRNKDLLVKLQQHEKTFAGIAAWVGVIADGARGMEMHVEDMKKLSGTAES